jgi:hypothetical protein
LPDHRIYHAGRTHERAVHIDADEPNQARSICERIMGRWRAPLCKPLSMSVI